MLIEAITKRQYNNKVSHHADGSYTSGRGGPGNSNFQKDKPKLFPVGMWLDYRLLLVASMLPDIIDKPLGQVFMKDTFNYGRIYAHTLVFVLVAGILGMWVFKKWGTGWLLTMSFGSLMHDMEDQLWRWPQVLWWPLKGWSFPQEDLSAWLSGVFHAIVTEPDVFIPELVGIAVLAMAAVRVFGSKTFIYFLKTGHLG